MTKPRVLIVDDSLTVRMDLADAFGEAGYEATLCATADEAREALRQSPPALVLLDVVLPDGDGVDILAELRNTPATRQLPVILLSSEAEVKDRIRGLHQGADAYIGKPYDSAYVVAWAAKLLRGASNEPGAPLLVLVIDDSLTYREELAAALHKQGYRTSLSSSGEDGLKNAAERHPDLIIVDGVMEGMDGTAVIRSIRLDPALQSTPCVLLTASEGAATEVVALDAGADAYVRKTEGTDVVMARVSAITRSTTASRNRTRGSSLLGPKRILAVDDSRTYLGELVDHLSGEGYEVVKVESGEEALELLNVDEVDCILLDLLMPGLSGTETCRRIKAQPALRGIPLIMLTAMDEQQAMIAGINAGADDYVSKSAQFDVLKARLRAQLRRKEFEDENRRVGAELLRKDVEAAAIQKVADARKELLDELSAKNEALAFYVDELERLNKELEVFAYSVSHDLRQPLRGMDGFSQILLERYGNSLDEQGRHYLGRIRAGSQRMSELIDGLLSLSRVSRRELVRRPIELSTIAQAIVARLRDAEPTRAIHVHIHEPLQVHADAQLVESALENLIGNAWKFTSKRPDASIEIGSQDQGDARELFVRDNGAGLDMNYADKLFGPFQRLHSQKEFPGTGIGLATVQRIIHRHGGRIRIESKPDEGATFFFTLHDRSNT